MRPSVNNEFMHSHGEQKRNPKTAENGQESGRLILSKVRVKKQAQIQVLKQANKQLGANWQQLGGGKIVAVLEFGKTTKLGYGNSHILDALERIADRAVNGEQFEVVTLSQNDFEAGADTEAIDLAIQELQDDFDIPVVVKPRTNEAEWICPPELFATQGTSSSFVASVRPAKSRAWRLHQTP